MKIIQVPFCFYPDAVGGTEIYVAELSRLLREMHGMEIVIAAPAERARTYVHEGLLVRRFACSPISDPGELYGEGDAMAEREFGEILDKEKPDIVHLHAFTRGVSLKLVRAAKTGTIPVVFTYHTPTVSCLRGTMMRWGAEPCDGVMDARTCAACTLNGKGVPRLGAQVLANFRFPLPASRFRVATALRMRSLVELRHATTRSLFDEVDHIIAVCRWAKDVLIRNGVPEEKITLCRQGVVEKLEIGRWKPGDESTRSASSLRIAFFGRLEPIKGVHVLIQALRSLPSAQMALDIFGIAQVEAGNRYEQRLRALAAGDNRIQFHAPVPADQVVTTLRNYDLLAVPSQWLETGPLVVLEAFAAGIPVIGPRLGGIAELVTDGVNGILVEPNSVPVWADALEKISRELLNNLRAQIQPPRTMSEVAEEMANLYSMLSNPVPHRALV